LGAAHACANPLTAHYGTAHGAAIANRLTGMAAAQWTGRFNPRPFAATAALDLYRTAYRHRHLQ
jgi:hypothetical protein